MVQVALGINAVADFIDGFDAADLKHMFGDHVKVVVTKEGSTTEEYDHD